MKYMMLQMPVNSSMIDGRTILEIPANEFSRENVDSLIVCLENMSPILEEEDFERIIEFITQRSVQRFVVTNLTRYTGKRRTSERVADDVATARYNTTNVIDDNDSDDDEY